VFRALEPIAHIQPAIIFARRRPVIKIKVSLAVRAARVYYRYGSRFRVTALGGVL